MPFEAHGGVNFHVQELGSGPPMVMLHGLLVGSMATWYFSAAQALARTHHVLLYDLRGHGKSERPASGYDIATMASDLEALCARFEQPITLVGHSYGAVIALYFALRFPKRVRKLVLVEAPLPPSRLEEFQAFLEKPTADKLKALPALLMSAVARGGRQASRFVAGISALATETSLFTDLERAEDFPDLVLAGLPTPTLCIYGSQSSCLCSGQRLAQLLPNVELITLEGGHFLPSEIPQTLTSSILEFAHG